MQNISNFLNTQSSVRMRESIAPEVGKKGKVKAPAVAVNRDLSAM